MEGHELRLVNRDKDVNQEGLQSPGAHEPGLGFRKSSFNLMKYLWKLFLLPLETFDYRSNMTYFVLFKRTFGCYIENEEVMFL